MARKEPIDEYTKPEEPRFVRQLSIYFLANGNTAAQVFYVDAEEGDELIDEPYQYTIKHGSGMVERINKRMIAYERDRMIRKKKNPADKEDK